VTVGQRRGMGHGTDGRRRFVTSVDVPARRVTIGPPEASYASDLELGTVAWVNGPPTGAAAIDGMEALAQCSAHGPAVACTLRVAADGLAVRFADPQRRVAMGQTVALYDLGHPEDVVGSGVVR
jgi:tRNA U34 2-thiouridine synthase MnmA/TrmU